MAPERFIKAAIFFLLISICQSNRPKLMEGDIMAVAPALKNADVGIKNKNHWPGNVIPFQFANGYPENLKQIFHVATKHISDQTCLRFVHRTNENDYVNVFQGVGCWSLVGRYPGGQNMSIPSNCGYLGTVVHEILHAVGFQHEQSRFDRDRYVKIILDNIEDSKKNNFIPHTMELGTRYDYNSVMHYNKNAFSKNGKDTIVPKWKQADIGWKQGLSRGDNWEINKKFCM